MDFEAQIKEWHRGDPERMNAERMDALESVSTLKLNDWCIAAGFFRKLVWGKLPNKEPLTPLNDVEVIYFNPGNTNENWDKSLERQLNSFSTLPWSIKNQARMHERNHDQLYTSIIDAMSYRVELGTAVGVTLSSCGEIEVSAPFGIEMLFENSITINNKRRKPDDFHNRIKQKQWLLNWPNLKISGWQTLEAATTMPHRISHIDTDIISADGSPFQIGMRHTNFIPEELALQPIYPCIDQYCSTCGGMTQASRQTLFDSRTRYRFNKKGGDNPAF